MTGLKKNHKSSYNNVKLYFFYLELEKELKKKIRN